MINYELWVVVFIAVSSFVVLRWVERRLAQVDLRGKVEELENRVNFLWNELQVARARIVELQEERNNVGMPIKPLLLICGPDNKICDSDRHALRRAHISFQRLLESTKEKVTEELRRKREAGQIYPWLHITAHAIEEGIALMDGIAPPAFWNEILDGIEVVVLAACKSTKVADELAGMVTVIYISEDIGDRDASSFTYAFWRRMREHGDAVKAYRQAINEATQVAEFTDIRTR